ncbi:MAG: hypothetical protein IV090_27170 [Candidatus Sericytochromatia bacterium]|nr:hypothetical protein [Candidatus Sericytochromatia bacterium]
MGRIHAAAICLILAACQPLLPPSPTASPLPGASQSPSSSQPSTTQSHSLRPSASALPTPTAFPSPTPVPTYSEAPIPIRTLPPDARPTPMPDPPLLSSALTVLAGSDAPGFQDGKGEDARFQGPQGLDLDLQGNLYVADTENHAIRKISPQGEVSTIAGMGQAGDADGLAKQAQFRYPQRLTLDNAGHIFVIENIALEKDPATGQLRYMNVPVLQRIRKVNLSEQKVTQLILSNSDVLKKRLLDIVWHSSEKKTVYFRGEYSSSNPR